MGTTRSKIARAIKTIKSIKVINEVKSKREVSKILKLSTNDFQEFENEGLFEFADRDKQFIDEKNIERLRVATSLKRDLGINSAGIDVILNMREKMKRMRMDMNRFLSQVRKKMDTRLVEVAQNIKKEIE